MPRSKIGIGGDSHIVLGFDVFSFSFGWNRTSQSTLAQRESLSLVRSGLLSHQFLETFAQLL